MDSSIRFLSDSLGIREIIDKYRSRADSERSKGDLFEELMARYFMTDPVYADDLEWAKTWMNFPYRDQFGYRDVGIDIVAKTKTGEY